MFETCRLNRTRHSYTAHSPVQAVSHNSQAPMEICSLAAQSQWIMLVTHTRTQSLLLYAESGRLLQVVQKKEGLCCPKYVPLHCIKGREKERPK